MQVKGKAELIRYTADPEQTVALAAKLCYSGDGIDELIEKIGDKDNAKFINILTKMNHFSPFEHASFTFAIEGVSRALLAQITRHRIASFSVRSQRYVSEGEFNYVVPPAIEALGADAAAKYRSQMEQMLVWYREWQTALGDSGEKSNEDARFVLPNACETKMIVSNCVAVTAPSGKYAALRGRCFPKCLKSRLRYLPNPDRGVCAEHARRARNRAARRRKLKRAARNCKEAFKRCRPLRITHVSV